MMEGVRNRVASFEAENEERRKSFGPKSPGALSSSPPQKSRTFLSLSNNPNYSSPQAPASSIDHNDEQDHSNEQQHHHDGHQSSSTSAAASESRKSRLRQQQQQQQVQETVRPTNLMLRKKKLKEQRKSRQFGGSSTTNHHSAPNGESSSSSNIGNNLNRHPNEAGEEESGIHPIDHSESSAQIVTPTMPGEEEQPTFLSEGEAKGGGGGDLDHSPFRKSPGSRITKMQRMQKMKGYEQVKKGQYPHLSSASPPPSVANSNATTAVARNTRGGDGRAVTVAMADPPKSTYSPPPSPVYSDNHTYLDHANTDDDATLTSVHRIMNSEARISSGEAPSKSSRPNSSTVFNTNGMSGPIKSNSSYSKHRLNHEYRMGQQGQNQNHHWLDEEKSDKHGEIMYRTPSSSDYDTDGDHSKTSKTSRQSQTSDVNDFFQRSRFQASASRRADDDERTFDYAENDDHSDGSASYATRQQREAEKRAREATGDDINTTKSQSSKNNPPPLINKDGVEHYAKSFEDPKMRLGAGVVGAATVGCIILGPLGLLMGAAAVGVGVGVMKIPEEQRNSMQEKAQKKFGEYQEKALEASEKLSNSCANHYKDSGLAEHMPECMVVAGNEVAEHLPQCVSTTDADANNDAQSHVSDKNTIVTKGVPGGSVKGSVVPDGPDVKRETSTSPSGQGLGRFMSRHKKVACLRTARLIPMEQIYGLDPASQPKAWLEVMASANTTLDQKLEAMEEILILAKDKRRARIFLNEGLLDSLLWILGRYFEKKNAEGKEVNWANLRITSDELRSAKLAATCCVTLGKAHCALMHTEGDLLLMSQYENGKVPEERQVAQMLHEVPHHARVRKTNDPTIINLGQEEFALKQLTLPQAEELAHSIKLLADEK